MEFGTFNSCTDRCSYGNDAFFGIEGQICEPMRFECSVTENDSAYNGGVTEDFQKGHKDKMVPS